MGLLSVKKTRLGDKGVQLDPHRVQPSSCFPGPALGMEGRLLWSDASLRAGWLRDERLCSAVGSQEAAAGLLDVPRFPGTQEELPGDV